MYFLVYREEITHLTSMGGWPQRTRGSRRSRSARAQGRHATRGLRPSGVYGIGYRRDPMRLFFYCNSHKSQVINRNKFSRQIQETFLINFLTISGNFEEFFLLLHFLTNFFCRHNQKSNFLSFGNDHTVIAQY